MWRLMLATALTILATAATAQIFECIDAKGNKEYTRHCPAGTVQQRQIWKGVEAGEDANPGAVIPPPQKSIDQQGVEFRKRLLERQEAEATAAKEKADAEEAAGNCNEARGQLKGLEVGQRISRVDPDTGERIPLGDEDRAARIVGARKTVEQWCKQ